MSTRERWIVYPLLFLALGTAIKPKLIHPQLADTALPPATLRIGRVECAELAVLGRNEQPAVNARASSSGGVIEILDAKQRKVVSIRADAATRAGLVETQNDQGRPQAAIMSSAAGGEFAAYDNSLNRSVMIGFRNGRSGLIQTDLRTGKESFESTTAPD
jgi:hypothetical protein